MSGINGRLAAVAALLLVLSFLSYRQSVTRADRFERGQRFLANLNPDEIATIVLSEGPEEGETTTLKRQGDGFVVAERHDYPASNSAVNRLLRDLEGIELEKPVGRGEDLAADLGIEPLTEKGVQVRLLDEAEQEMVRLRVGNRFEEGPGSYVQRLDGEPGSIYLTSRSVSLPTEVDSFLDMQILETERESVRRIEGTDFTLAWSDEEGRLQILQVPAGKKEKRSETSGLTGLIASLRYDEVYLADDAEIDGLAFQQAVRYELDDGSGYVLATATRGDETFLRISGFHSVERVAISQEESEEELEKKAELLSRGDEIREFNAFHGSWVYAVNETAGRRLALRKADLLEDA